MKDWKEKMQWTRLNYAIIVLFLMALLAYAGIHPTYLMGEWDDYSLPVASLFHDHNFSISDEDIAYHKQLFPEWADDLDRNYELSGYYTKDGAELTWYFPTYSIVCMPMTVLLWLMKLPRIYAFSFTNILVYGLALLAIVRFLDAPETKKLLLVLAVAVHPAVFYVNYIGAEVFLYALLVAAFVFWYNKKYHRAALLVAVAGTMNATILAVGLVMIAEYLFYLWKKRPVGESLPAMVKRCFWQVICYGACYIIGIVPMAYNLIMTGHINLTASYEKYTVSRESVIERAFSYLFDLNYGMLPYFPMIVWLAFLLLAVAVWHKNGAYIKWIFTGMVLVLLYSVMVHINSGMDGIARYNVWGSVPFIFGVVLYYDVLLGKHFVGRKAPEGQPGMVVSSTGLAARIASVLLALNILWSAFMLWWYDPNRAANTAYIFMNPLAVKVLENAPALYNPLHSTFASRTLYKDGCYDYETPVVYKSYEDGSVRKVLATVRDADALREGYASEDAASNAWWETQLERLTEKEGYISVPGKYQIYPVEAGGE